MIIRVATKSVWFALQNPTLSMCWCMSVCQILIPVLTFTKDTQPFCKSMSVAETTLFLIYTTFAFLCNLLGPSFFDAADVFRFYKFPFSYTSWADLFVWTFLFAYLVTVPFTRKLWDKFELYRNNRIAPTSNV